MNDSKEETHKIIAEHKCNWIAHDVDEDFEFYTLYLVENGIAISMSAEALEELKVLFASLKPENKQSYVR